MASIFLNFIQSFGSMVGLLLVIILVLSFTIFFAVRKDQERKSGKDDL